MLQLDPDEFAHVYFQHAIDVVEYYQLCLCLKTLFTESKKSKKCKKSTMSRHSLFTRADHTKVLFGSFLVVPLFSKISVIEGLDGSVTRLLPDNSNMMYSLFTENISHRYYENIYHRYSFRGWNTRTHSSTELTMVTQGFTRGTPAYPTELKSFTIHQNKLYVRYVIVSRELIQVWKVKEDETDEYSFEHLETFTCQEDSEEEASSLVFAFDNTLVTSSYYYMKLWSTENYKLKGTLGKVDTSTHSHFIHEGDVLCVANNGKYLFSGSEDGKVIIWDTIYREYVDTLYGHAGGVTCITHLDSKTTCSGSRDGTIRVWSCLSESSYACVMTLRDHDDEISCIAVHGNMMLSGSHDKTIRVWDTSTSSYTCKRTMEGHSDKVLSLTIQENMLISGSDDKSIRMWKIAKPSRINLVIEKRIQNNLKKLKENKMQRKERKRDRENNVDRRSSRRNDRKRKKEQGPTCGCVKEVEIIDLTKE